MRRDDANTYSDLYAAQVRIVGKSGQGRLRRARVHVAGLGGIGFSLALQLAAAGVGIISANDPQNLSADNLNRFPCAGPEHIGIPKTALLRDVLKFGPERSIITSNRRNEQKGFGKLCENADLIACCSNSY